jgi:hypothetical protein
LRKGGKRWKIDWGKWVMGGGKEVEMREAVHGGEGEIGMSGNG